MAYIIKQGDTLSSIAQNSSATLAQLLELNPQFKSNPNQIQPGQTLNLPGAPITPVAPSPQPVAGTPVSAGLAGVGAALANVPISAPVATPQAAPQPTAQPVAQPPIQPTQPVQPVVQPQAQPQPQPQQPAGQPDTPSQIASLTKQVQDLQAQKDTITSAEAAGLPASPDNTVQQAQDYLASHNVSIDTNKATTNPEASWQDTYQNLFTKLGLDKVKTQIDDNIAKIQDLDNKLIDEIAEVNDDPWLSVGMQQMKIAKLKEKNELKRGVLANTLTLYQNTYTQGRQEAQFLVTTALSQYNAERTFDLNQQKMLADQAEAQAKALKDLSTKDTQVVEANGRKWLVTYDKDGNVINKVDLGKTTTTGQTPTITPANVATTLYNVGIPSSVSSAKGILSKSYYDKAVSAGLDYNVVDGIWKNIIAGNTFEEIRRGIKEQGGDPAILDTFVQILQGAGGGGEGIVNPF